MSTVVSAEVDLKQVASDVVARAMKAGASAADAIVREGDEFSVVVRLGQVETLKESGARALGLRVFMGQRVGSTYTSDFSDEGIKRLVDGAVQLAKIASEDPDAGLPKPEQLGKIDGDLGIYYDDVYSLPNEERIEYARRAERAAMEGDARITNSEGGIFEAATGHKVLANSLGFVGEYRSSYCSVVAVPIAEKDGQMQRDYWHSSARTIKKLDTPEAVGKEAQRRTLMRLGARKVATQKVPIVFDQDMSAALIGHVFDALTGDAIYRHASYLAGQLGKVIAGPNITLVDDGTMSGGFGSSPFDGEGVPTQRTTLVDQGTLSSYVLNCYTARKLKLKTTGNAARGVTGNPGIGSGNYYLQPGSESPDDIIKSVKKGLYVTQFLGTAVNLVTGDFSRGASGMWIEDGQLAFPVEEITVAGNLKDMFMHIGAVGNDLVWRGSTASPTLLIEGMTVAGE
jgi:PmbA protein